MVYWVCNKRLLYKIKFSIYLLKPIYFFYYLLSLSLNLTDIYCWYSLSTYNLKVNTLRKSLQTTSALPCRTQVQPEASFLVCSFIFIEFYFIKRNAPPRRKSIFYWLFVNCSGLKLAKIEKGQNSSFLFWCSER